jgi:hypothetical protein
MAKQESKPDDLWPAWDSPGRVNYWGDLARALYDEARGNFTEDNIKAAREALNPDPDFDLIGRLRRAVFHYFWFLAGQKGDNAALIDLRPKGVQKKELSDLIKKVSALVSIFERKQEFIAGIVAEYKDRDGISAALDFSQGFIADLKILKQMAEAKRAELKTDSGNIKDIARRVFSGHLLVIYEDAHGRRATTTKGRSAHYFFSVCWSCFIDPKISDESTLNYLKDAIDHRNAIKASPLFVDQPKQPTPAFTSQIVIEPASK